jgi:hypothetical protein
MTFDDKNPANFTIQNRVITRKTGSLGFSYLSVGDHFGEPLTATGSISAGGLASEGATQ